MTDQEHDRERDLKWRLGQLNTQLVAEASKRDSDKARVNETKQQMAQTESDLQKFTDALYAKYPELARKRAAKTVTLENVAKILPDDTALLNYVALQARNLDKTVLFCVTMEQGHPKLETYEIPKPLHELAELADDFRDACAPGGARGVRRIGATADERYRSKARDLYRLLILPAARQLAGKKRLVICPDGPLWGLPFQALVADSESPTTGHFFLLEQYAISYAYSATALEAALLAKTDGERTKPTGTLLTMANPDFGGTTTGAKQNKGAEGRGAEQNLGASFFLRGDGQLEPLPGTQLEAESLQAIFGGASIYTRNDAQEVQPNKKAANSSIFTLPHTESSTTRHP